MQSNGLLTIIIVKTKELTVILIIIFFNSKGNILIQKMVEEFGVISVCDKDKISMSFCRSAFERKPIGLGTVQEMLNISGLLRAVGCWFPETLQHIIKD